MGESADIETIHGRCGQCGERFSLADGYVAYGGLLWCDEDCLATYVAENGLDIERVAEGLEHRRRGNQPGGRE